LIPSFEYRPALDGGLRRRIQVLEIRPRLEPEGKVLAWLMVEREETRWHSSEDGAIQDASILLSFQRITSRWSNTPMGGGSFAGSYSRDMNAVSLTSTTMSDGGVYLDLPGIYGQRIGTYLMNEIVRFVRQWPAATVNTVKLVEGNARGENRVRRNKFYEQFGLVFEYSDCEGRAGHSKPMMARDLVLVESWKANIAEIGVSTFLTDVLSALEQSQAELRARDSACSALIEAERAAAAHPVAWAIGQLWHRATILGTSSAFVLGVVVVLFVVSLLWKG